ncbi:MAG: hypothetical protein BWY56_02231 [Acidobacteria bacterium ADurb.Bin340]|nr:MAG: hypothetical protein BWY56_02231 [Acidobacteria bacterium ADurb.Bin340]
MFKTLPGKILDTEAHGLQGLGGLGASPLHIFHEAGEAAQALAEGLHGHALTPGRHAQRGNGFGTSARNFHQILHRCLGIDVRLNEAGHLHGGGGEAKVSKLVLEAAAQALGVLLGGLHPGLYFAQGAQHFLDAFGREAYAQDFRARHGAAP